MNAIKYLISRLAKQFSGARGRRALEVVARNVPRAMPYIEWAAALTPTSVDDIALSWLRDKYPRFFNGVPLTDEEMKLLRFLFASERLVVEDDELDNSAARAAVSNAFVLRRANRNG